MFSNNLDDHTKHVYEILTTSADAGVTLKITTYHSFQQQVEYFGHTVKLGQFEIDKTSVK